MTEFHFGHIIYVCDGLKLLHFERQYSFMTKVSAGIVLYRNREGKIEFLLGHMGGPFWSRKDKGAWTIPKGEFDPEHEDAFEAAKREFEEETSFPVHGEFLELQPIKQKGGKIVYAWALEYDLDPAKMRSNLFEIEWPPRSGKLGTFREIDKWEWVDMAQAKNKIISAQISLLEQVIEMI